MQIDGKTVVITGGGNGIGRALARRFATDGAGGIVVADLDGDAAETVAAEVDGVAVTVDVTDPTGNEEIVGLAEQRFGPVDLFCANAGIPAGGGVDEPLEAWQQAWDVNVMGHVLAAQAVLPSMLARGEWLPAAHGLGRRSAHQHRCRPLFGHQARRGRTGRVALDHLRRPGHSGLVPVPDGRAHRHVDGAAPTTRPERSCSPRVRSNPRPWPTRSSEGLRREDFLILPHPEVREFVRRKADDHDRWIAGMRRLQARFI